MRSKAQVSLEKTISVLQPSHDEGPEPVRVPDGEHLLVREKEQGVGAFDAPQGADKPVEGRVLMGEGDKVNDHFGVDGRLEDGAVVLQFLPNDLRVGEVAVMRYGEGTLRILDHEGLGVLDVARTRSRVPHVADSAVALHLMQHLLVEYVGDEAHLATAAHESRRCSLSPRFPVPCAGGHGARGT